MSAFRRRGLSNAPARASAPRRWLWLLLTAPLLAGCASGSPTVTSVDTPRTPDAGVVSPTPTAMILPTEQPATETATAIPPTARPTKTPRPKPTPSATAVPEPTSRPEPPAVDGELALVIDRGSGDSPEFAITIDAGGERGDAEAMLDILEDYGVVASFGVTGAWAEANPDLLQRMVDDGHMLINHGWSHESWTGQSTSSNPDDPSTWAPLSQAERLDELQRTDALVRELTGYEMQPYFRPPYADLDESVRADVVAGGYGVVLMWSCESLAWMGQTAEEIAQNCGGDPTPGDIVLLHVTDAGTDSDALPLLIESVRAQGFAFVTAEQIIQPE